MLSLDADILSAVVTAAKAQAAQHPRWLAAIERAAVELESNPWIAINGSHLLIGSGSGKSYDVNGSCQCSAYLHGQACWHRACRQLVARYQEAEADQKVAQRYTAAAQQRPSGFVCKGCGERTEERGLCYACTTRGPKAEPVYSSRVQRQAAAVRATAAINELF